MNTITFLPTSALVLLVMIVEYVLPVPGHRLRPATVNRDAAPLIHALALLIGSAGIFAVLTGELTWRFIGFLTFLAVCHLLLDGLKAPLYGMGKISRSIVWSLSLYFIGHGILLLLFTMFWGATIGQRMVETISVLTQQQLPAQQLAAVVNAAVITLGAYLFIGRGGAEIVRAVLDTLDMEDDHQQEEFRIGQTIGFLERYLLLTLVLLQQYGAIGFVLAAKSIARYSGITESKQFAEYYLVGTLTSAAIAITVGVVVQIFV